MSSKDLTSKVLKWLKKEGYGLEFEAASLFAKRGWSVIQGAYVNDPTSGQPREVDLVAYRHLTRGRISVSIACVCECKWAKTKPWVFFSSETREAAKEHAFLHLMGTGLAEAALWTGFSDPRVVNASLVSMSKRSVFGGVEALGSGEDRQDPVYKTISGTLARARGFASRADGWRQMAYLETPNAWLIIPVIFVDTQLYEAWYDEASELRTQQRDVVRVDWGGSEHGGVTRVHVARREGLDSLVSYFEQCWEGGLEDAIAESAEVVLKCTETHTLDPAEEYAGGRLPATPIPKFMRDRMLPRALTPRSVPSQPTPPAPTAGDSTNYNEDGPTDATEDED